MRDLHRQVRTIDDVYRQGRAWLAVSVVIFSLVLISSSVVRTSSVPVRAAACGAYTAAVVGFWALMLRVQGLSFAIWASALGLRGKLPPRFRAVVDPAVGDYLAFVHVARNVPERERVLRAAHDLLIELLGKARVLQSVSAPLEDRALEQLTRLADALRNGLAAALDYDAGLPNQAAETVTRLIPPPRERDTDSHETPDA